MGSTPVAGSENSFSEYFDLRKLLHYLYITFIHRKEYDCVSLARLSLIDWHLIVPHRKFDAWLY